MFVVRQAKSEADKQIASLSECVSRLQQQLKSCECEKATLQDQVQRLQDQTASLQRRLVAANDAQQRLLEVARRASLLRLADYLTRNFAHVIALSLQCFDTVGWLVGPYYLLTYLLTLTTGPH